MAVGYLCRRSRKGGVILGGGLSFCRIAKKSFPTHFSTSMPDRYSFVQRLSRAIHLIRYKKHSVHMPSIDIQGHRGARGLFPENTIPGFVHALELGVTTLEMDTVVTADDQVILSHEPWLSSDYCSHPDGRPVEPEEEESLLIFDMTYETVRSYDCGSRGHAGFPRQKAMKAFKPLLRDVIRAAETYRTEQGVDEFDYNIETKSSPDGDGRLHPDPESFTRLLYQVLKEENVLARSIIQSFDVRTLRAARRIDDQWRTSLLVDWEQNPPSVNEYIARLGFRPDILSPHQMLVHRDLVESAHAHGMLVIPWTVNDVIEMRNLAEMGVDGIITDYPDDAMNEFRTSAPPRVAGTG